MKISSKSLLAGVVLACASPVAQAQTETFDLSTQRSESQHVLPVPGSVVNHHGIIINPTPQSLQMMTGEGLALTGTWAIKDKSKSFAADLTAYKADKKGVKLNIEYGERAAKKLGVKFVSGAYALKVDSKGVTITGYDERGAFYGIQTLNQLLASPIASNGLLPALTINDYPDLPNRGVVEGFYGTPWSHEVRRSLIAYYGRNKLNTYLYGPKDDPYHSCPNWRLPYPEKEAARIKDLVEASRRARVDFVWAIHPGQDIKWNEEDYALLVGKFEKMYDLGVRHFAVFFDDINGEGTNPLKQTELLNRLTREWVVPKGDVSPLTVCPTDYSKLWAKPGEDGALAIYGKTLEKDIKVFWTGDVVCSDLTPSTLEFINSRIQRPAYYWWNYPVTDYARHILMQGPVYGLDTSLTANETSGLISNPMEHGEASKLALYGVADYAWNVKAFNPIDAWERGLTDLMPRARDAYRTFAIHSADTEDGYRRDESWETKTFSFAEWNEKDAEALKKTFKDVVAAPAEIEAGCDNKALTAELKPWLTEFEKLGLRGLRTLDLMKTFRSGNAAAFWTGYLDNLMSDADRKTYSAHRCGTMKLQPFYEDAMDDMAHEFLKTISGRTPKDYRAVGSFPACGTIRSKQMLDGDTLSHFTSGQAQSSGDWIGLDLRAVRDVREIDILQGRNSVNDGDYFERVSLQVSEDGKTWTTLKGDLKKQYVIQWTGEPVKARYVRLLRLDTDKPSYAAIREFRVNPLRGDNLGFALTAPDSDKAVAAFDENLATSYRLNGEMRFEAMPGATSVTFLFGKVAAPVKAKMLDETGAVVSEAVLPQSFTTLSLTDKKVKTIVVTGEVKIYEISQQ